MNDDSSTFDQERSPLSPAHVFNLFDWKPDETKTDDENYMDIVFLITRSKRRGKQGHMGALIVNPTTESTLEESPPSDDNISYNENRLFQGILGAATNTPLFGTKDCTSDIHAEIVALGQACRSKRSTEKCTAYITIPPCKRCFAALVTFGIKRIVTRQVSPQVIRDTASDHGICVEHFSPEMNRSQMERINKLANKDKSDDELMEIAERNKIKRQNRKIQKKEKSIIESP
jgi:deoxycytidylate deaminase